MGEQAMGDLCAGRVVIVTGAGRGIGRAEALGFAVEGAKVVVADIGVELDGTGATASVGRGVVDEIIALGGEAVLSTADVGDAKGAQEIFELAVDTFGGIDVIVNNAGILRDKMIFNMDESDFDAVIRVHLKGTFNLNRLGAIYWRDRNKEGLDNDARIINTSSPAGLYGNVGQQNYSAAKAGTAAMVIGLARELGRYGVTANAISPGARTRMTDSIPRPGKPAPFPTAGPDLRGPENVAPLVVWLGSSEAKGVTGQVFEVGGGRIAVAEGYRHGPSVDSQSTWVPSELGPLVTKIVAEAYQVPVPGGPRQSSN
jgi:NAD(P)-dependent dehydrogenase (short-subunit alcohol dehydrogenase family)